MKWTSFYPLDAISNIANNAKINFIKIFCRNHHKVKWLHVSFSMIAYGSGHSCAINFIANEATFTKSRGKFKRSNRTNHLRWPVYCYHRKAPLMPLGSKAKRRGTGAKVTESQDVLAGFESHLAAW